MVDVVVPTYNASALLGRCLDHLEDPEVGRMIVVDDASEDGTVEMMRHRFPEVTVVALDSHRGLAYAFNRGAAAGNADYVLFLNNDVFARPGAVTSLVNALADHPDAVSAGGRLVEPGTDSTQAAYSPRAIPGLAGLVVRLTGVERMWMRNPWTGQHLRRPLAGDTVSRIDRQPAGACLLVRRAALEAIGGWDERYWFWYEDVDLARRLSRVGDALYVPQAAFEHVGTASTRHWARHERHRRLYDGTVRYGEAHLSRPARMLLGVVAMAATAHRIVGYALLRPAASEVYRQVFRGGLALVLGRQVPSAMTDAR